MAMSNGPTDRTSPGSVAGAPPAPAVGAVTVPDRSTTQGPARVYAVAGPRRIGRTIDPLMARGHGGDPAGHRHQNQQTFRTAASWPPHFKHKHGRVCRLDHAA